MKKNIKIYCVLFDALPLTNDVFVNAVIDLWKSGPERPEITRQLLSDIENEIRAELTSDFIATIPGLHESILQIYDSSYAEQLVAGEKPSGLLGKLASFIMNAIGTILHGILIPINSFFQVVDF